MRKYLFAGLFSTLIVFAGCSKENINPPANLNNRSVGSSANELLSSTQYQTLNIEIAYMPGFVPDAAALTNLQNFLDLLVNKPGGIHINTRQIAPSGKASLTLTEVRDIEKNNRTGFSSGTSLSIFILYTDGVYSTANTLGIAHKNTSIAVFGKTIDDHSGSVNQATQTKLETTTLEHEVGHLLGLVDLGTPMLINHKDAASSHCNNNTCLMYFKTDAGQMGGVLITSPVPSLDVNCRNDLRANGGK